MLPGVITHTENEVFHSLQKGMFLFNLIGLVIEPHVFHRSTLLSCDCLHDQASNGLASGISRVAQRWSYEGRGCTVGKVDAVHVDGKYIERTLVEGAIGFVECAECPCHSVAIKVSHRFVEKGLSFCGVGACGQARTIHREHEDSCGGAAKHCSESHGRLLLGRKAEANLEQSVARKLGLVPRTSGLNISTAVRKKAFSEPTTLIVDASCRSRAYTPGSSRPTSINSLFTKECLYALEMSFRRRRNSRCGTTQAGGFLSPSRRPMQSVSTRVG